MATLYVRNVPAELYAKLQEWAAESGRSLNSAVLEVLEREVGHREQDAEFERLLAELKEKNTPVVGPPWPEDLIREHRYGREPGFGD
ncbi:MAG TPA: hypothetical protein VMU74_11720 [Gaiellaceae bacterium]|nr:hypothetical protein [Gaiellaceae bacterium]